VNDFYCHLEDDIPWVNSELHPWFHFSLIKLGDCRNLVSASIILTNAVILLPLEGTELTHMIHLWVIHTATFYSLDRLRYASVLGCFQAPHTDRSSNLPYRISSLVLLHRRRSGSFCVSYTFMQTGKFHVAHSSRFSTVDFVFPATDETSLVYPMCRRSWLSISCPWNQT